MHCNNYNHLRLKLPNGFRLTVLCFIDMYLLSPRSADTSFPYSEPPLNPIKQASSISVEAFLYLISTLKSTVYCNSSRIQDSGFKVQRFKVVSVSANELGHNRNTVR